MQNKAQSAMEYMITYGWAFILLTIVVAIVFFYLQVPQKASPPTCTITSTLLCEDTNLGTYAGTGTTVATFYFINEGTYPLSDPEPKVSYNNNNNTGSCFPSLVPPGGKFLCQVNLNTITSLGQFLGGSIYVSVYNCGVVAGYIVNGNCNNAPSQTLTGTFSGHTEAPLTFYAYVSDQKANSIYVIDLANNTEVNTITIPNHGFAITASPFSGYVYVASPGGVFVINTSTRTLTSTLLPGVETKGIAMNPYGSRIYVSTIFSPLNLYTVDTATGDVVNTLYLGRSVPTLALSQNSRYVYAPEENINTIVVMSTSNYQIVNSVNTGTVEPWGVATAPFGSSVYYAGTDGGGGTAAKFDASNYVITGSVSTGSNPQYVSVTPDGNLEFISNQGSDTITVVNTTNNVVIGTISISGSIPQGSQTSLFGTYTYVTNQGTGTIGVVNTSTLSVTNTIALPGGSSATPYGIAFTLH